MHTALWLLGQNIINVIVGMRTKNVTNTLGPLEAIDTQADATMLRLLAMANKENSWRSNSSGSKGQNAQQNLVHDEIRCTTTRTDEQQR